MYKRKEGIEKIKSEQVEYCLIRSASVSPLKNSFPIAGFYTMLFMPGNANQYEFSIYLLCVFASITPIYFVLVVMQSWANYHSLPTCEEESAACHTTYHIPALYKKKYHSNNINRKTCLSRQANCRSDRLWPMTVILSLLVQHYMNFRSTFNFVIHYVYFAI